MSNEFSQKSKLPIFNGLYILFYLLNIVILNLIIFGNTKFSKAKINYTLNTVNKRKLSLGKRNISGKRVTEARKLKKMSQVELLAKMQVMGVEISIPALSLLEGQKGL